MPTLLATAVPPILAAPAEVYVSAGTMHVGPPTNPLDPSDPAVTFEPPAAGDRLDVEIRRAITHEPVGFLVSAVVEDWIPGDVELLAGTAATVTASSWDPLWAEMANGDPILGVDGLAKTSWDPKGYEAIVYRNGRAEAPYVFLQPVDIGGGRVALPMVGPQEQFNHRFLGRPEQVDLLDDRGSFEGSDPLAGWIIPDGVTATIVSDGVRGSRALRLTGDGWVRSPRVAVTGAQGYSRVVDGLVFGKWSGTVPSGAVVARAQVTGTAFGAPVYDESYALANAAQRPNEDSGWTEDPMTFAARMAPTATAQRARLLLRSFDGADAFYDLAQLRLSVSTGFPPGTTRHYGEYVERIHDDAVTPSLGGYPTGLSAAIVSHPSTFTSPTSAMRWAHARRTPLRDVFAAVLEADGGPECRITPAMVLEIHSRLGRDRDDFVLSPLDCAQGDTWERDPGAQIDDYLVDTGRGSGVAWLAAAVSQSTAEARYRIQAIVQGPTDRTLNQIESWARAHARAAARPAVTARRWVPWVLADQLAVGDVFPEVLQDGALGEQRWTRLLRKRYVRSSRLCELTMGPTDA